MRNKKKTIINEIFFFLLISHSFFGFIIMSHLNYKKQIFHFDKTNFFLQIINQMNYRYVLIYPIPSLLLVWLVLVIHWRVFHWKLCKEKKFQFGKWKQSIYGTFYVFSVHNDELLILRSMFVNFRVLHMCMYHSNWTIVQLTMKISKN